MRKQRRNRTAIKKRLCSAVLSAVMLASFILTAVPQNTQAASSKSSTISIADFASKINKAVDIDVLADGALKNTKAATTTEVAAYLLEKADFAINGGVYSYDYD